MKIKIPLLKRHKKWQISQHKLWLDAYTPLTSYMHLYLFLRFLGKGSVSIIFHLLSSGYQFVVLQNIGFLLYCHYTLCHKL